MKRFIIIIAAVMLAAVCCKESNGMLYRTLVPGFMQDNGSMLADDGNTYLFNNPTMPEAFLKAKRVVALMDVIDAVDGQEKTFNAMMLEYALPVYKDPAECSTTEEIEALGKDPVNVTNIWYSGGCLNLQNVIMIGPDPEVKHTISLAMSPVTAESDTLHFTLCHDAAADATLGDLDGLTRYSFYSSFPIKDLLPETGSRVVELKWFWDEEWNSKYNTISR